jgi:hypothetical protein
MYVASKVTGTDVLRSMRTPEDLKEGTGEIQQFIMR